MNSFRENHNCQVARMFNWLFFIQIIFSPILAYIYKTEYSIAILVSTFVWLSSVIAANTLRKSPLLPDAYGASAMFSSMTVMYMMRGIPEAHFHFFMSMSFLIAFASPRAIVVATGVIAVHHLVVYFFFPGIGFPVDYPLELYATHFVAAVGQAIPCFLIAYKAASIVDNQGTIIQDLKSHATESKSRSAKLLDQSSHLNKLVVSQAQGIDETVATLDELSSMMNSNLDSIESSRQRVTQTDDIIKKGHTAMVDVSSFMKDLDQTNERLLDEIRRITESFEEILTMMKTIESRTQIINDITFQTKLLSFNASVEAARAGEAGRGFSVVAEEVAILAQTSSSAATEINGLLSTSGIRIETLLTNIQGILEAFIEDSKEKVRIGSEGVENSITQLDHACEVITSLHQTFDSIATASKEQNLGFNNILEAIRLFRENLRSTQDMVESGNQLSLEMSHKSREILDFVSTLQNSQKEKHQLEEENELDTPPRLAA